MLSILKRQIMSGSFPGLRGGGGGKSAPPPPPAPAAVPETKPFEAAGEKPGVAAAVDANRKGTRGLRIDLGGTSSDSGGGGSAGGLNIPT